MLFPAIRDTASGEQAERTISGLIDRIGGGARAFLLLSIIIFGASMLGLASRHTFSVSFWPANAVLVGCALRDRRLACVTGYAGAAVGYIAADLVFGRSWSLALMFAGTNLISAMATTAILRPLGERDLSLRGAYSVLRIFAGLLPGSIVAGLCGALLVTVSFGGSAAQTLLTWPASELVNYLVVLPAILTVRLAWLKDWRLRTRGAADLWPVLLLAISCAAAVYFDGPGSIMFPVPALLLCALTYSVPTTALLTVALGMGCLTVLGMEIMDIGQDMSVPRAVLSVRIAVSFLVLVPLTISSAMAVRDDLLRQLRNAADHDGLTGLLNRRAFEQRLHERLRAQRSPEQAFVILWLDIDHFKSINDRHGHLAGDAVLRAFAVIARTCCRDTDLVGRLGGEEFALLVEVPEPGAAVAVAERLLKAFANHLVLWDDAPVRATVSMGACYLDRAVPDISDIIRRLDEALYRAKRDGRNRIEWVPAVGEPSRSSPSLTSARVVHAA